MQNNMVKNKQQFNIYCLQIKSKKIKFNNNKIKSKK